MAEGCARPCKLQTHPYPDSQLPGLSRDRRSSCNVVSLQLAQSCHLSVCACSLLCHVELVRAWPSTCSHQTANCRMDIWCVLKASDVKLEHHFVLALPTQDPRQVGIVQHQKAVRPAHAIEDGRWCHGDVHLQRGFGSLADVVPLDEHGVRQGTEEESRKVASKLAVPTLTLERLHGGKSSLPTGPCNTSRPTHGHLAQTQCHSHHQAP